MSTSSKKRQKNVNIALSLIAVAVLFYTIKSFFLVHDNNGVNSILGFTGFTFSYQAFILTYFGIVLAITSILLLRKFIKHKQGTTYSRFFFLVIILCVIIWLYESVHVGDNMMFHFSEH